MTTANEILQDRSIRHAVFFQRVTTREANQIIGLVNDRLIPDLVGTLEARLQNIATRGIDTSVRTTKRLRDMIGAANDIVDTRLRHVRLRLNGALLDIAGSEARFQTRLLEEVMPVDVKFITPSPTLLRSIVVSRPMQGKHLRDWFGEFAQATRREIRQQINLGLAAGESVPAMVRRIRGSVAANFLDGTAGKIRRTSEAIVRTAANHVSNHARQAVYEANQDVVKGWRFVATLDQRTTDICASNDGKVWPVGEGFMPPLHVNCRSSSTPILRSWKELGIDLKEAPAGTRASLDGQVPAKQTYGGWLKTQPTEVQNEVLGVGRAKIFRRGEIDITHFVDRKNRPLSLKELTALENRLSFP
jgi:SPP1 gp7 family putative phage head morphogenesis protein